MFHMRQQNEFLLRSPVQIDSLGGGETVGDLGRLEGLEFGVSVSSGWHLMTSANELQKEEAHI